MQRFFTCTDRMQYINLQYEQILVLTKRRTAGLFGHSGSPPIVLSKNIVKL